MYKLVKKSEYEHKEKVFKLLEKSYHELSVEYEKLKAKAETALLNDKLKQMRQMSFEEITK